jgi:hypothetical protein
MQRLSFPVPNLSFHTGFRKEWSGNIPRNNYMTFGAWRLEGAEGWAFSKQGVCLYI